MRYLSAWCFFAGIDNQTSEQADRSATVTYESERGPIEISAHPQRIAALMNAPNVLAAGGGLIGVDQWTQGNSLFMERLNGVKVVLKRTWRRSTAATYSDPISLEAMLDIFRQEW
ncbi:hypothetical protein PA598K_06529 [Paenibacillus sp. 598K]|uniref:hypothetical protein n=1 Tax=Paenibacillus sp. 598K TaxID=1117987 RepID=UPI000FF9B604|nr:hypothetical protein [Paenibacillus sp. 598K]GBF77945.1 hypothetical protein PA598K_06529 [Paenibacillus sp. 598K]